MRSLIHVDVPPGRTALFDARERAMVLQRAALDLLQHLEGRNAAQLAYNVLPLPLDCFHALRQFTGNGLVGEPQPHLLQRGALDFAELANLLLNGEAELALQGSLRVFKAEALECIEERIVGERLFEHRRCTHFHRGHCRLHVGIGADQDGGDRTGLPDDPQDLEARQHRQAVVENDAAGAVEARLFQQVLEIAPAIDLQTDGFDQRAQRIAELIIIVNDVYAVRHAQLHSHIYTHTHTHTHTRDKSFLRQHYLH